MRRNRRGKRKIIIALIIAAALLALFIAGLQFAEKLGLKDVQFGDTGEWGDGKIETTELSLNNKLYVTKDNLDTYLIIGTDSGGIDEGEMYSGELADFVTLLLVDNTTKKFAFLQMDRNSMVEMAVPDETGNAEEIQQMQLCISHWYGRDADERNEYTAAAVTTLLGDLEIDNVYSLEMTEIGAVNHAIGGVEVDIETDMTNVDPAFVKGAHVLLDDDQAEKFVRARMNVGKGTNAERMARQTQYMQKAYNLVMNQLRENPNYINDLYKELDGVVYSSGSAKDFSRLTNQLLEYEALGIMHFTGTTKMGDTLGEGLEKEEYHEEFYVDDESILACYKKIMNIKEQQ